MGVWHGQKRDWYIPGGEGRHELLTAADNTNIIGARLVDLSVSVLKDDGGISI